MGPPGTQEPHLPGRDISLKGRMDQNLEGSLVEPRQLHTASPGLQVWVVGSFIKPYLSQGLWLSALWPAGYCRGTAVHPQRTSHLALCSQPCFSHGGSEISVQGSVA